MFFRMIADDKLAQYAYLIGCQKTGDAIVIDPERDVDRYVEIASQSDSLRTVLRQRVFGETVTLSLRADSLAGRVLRLETAASGTELEVLEGDDVEPLAAAQGGLLQWTVPPGQTARLRVRVPGEACDFRVALAGGERIHLFLGRRRVAWNVGRERTVWAGDELFFQLLDEATSPARAGLHLSATCEGWLQSED